LTVTNGGRIDTSTFTEGAGGNIDVHASELISVAGAGSRISSMAAAEGEGGEVRLSAPRIEVVDGGAVSARSGPGFGLLGGLLWPIEEELPEQADGAAGLVRLEARDTLRVRGGSVSSQAETAFGGGVEVQAGSLVYLLDGTITANSGAQDGGNVRIDPEFVVLNHSDITANAEGPYGGDGGNIDITGEYVFVSPDSVISASSRSGVSGTVVIRSPDVDLSGELTSLPESYVDASALLKSPCAVRTGGREGSLIVEGRDGVPESPDRPRHTLYTQPALFAKDSPIGGLWRDGEAAEGRGDFEAAIASWRGAAKIVGESGDPRIQTEVHLRLAQAYESVGNLSQALRVLTEAREKAEASSDLSGRARVLGVRSRVLAQLGATAPALEVLRTTCLRCCTRTGPRCRFRKDVVRLRSRCSSRRPTSLRPCRTATTRRLR
jgi:hypothetical protein